MCKPEEISMKENMLNLEEGLEFSLLESSEEENENTPPSCYSEYWRENRISATHTYSCEDYKYFIPSDKGPIPLVFKVTVHASWKDHDACKGIVECDCPEDAEDCSECRQTGCTECVLKEK